MQNYTYTGQTGNLSATLWTEGESNAHYYAQLIITDQSGGANATATVNFTEGGVSKSITASTTAAEQGGQQQAGGQGNINVDAGTPVTLTVAWSSGTYSVNLQTAAPETFDSSPDDTPPTLYPES